MISTDTFKDSFPISGAMCFQGCGRGIKIRAQNALDEWLKNNQLFIKSFTIDSQPGEFGVHYLSIEMKTEEKVDASELEVLKKKLREAIAIEPISIIDGKEEPASSNKTNWINIGINLVALLIIITVSLTFPPSLPLTIGLTVFSILTTAFTARAYLFKFLRGKELATMTTSITFGWTLSAAHTLYHSIMMPIARSFSMVFMSFAMPVMLISFINGMDEIKRVVLSKAKKMQLRGIKSLFPEMAEKYSCYELTTEEQERFSPEMLSEERAVPKNRSTLKEGMYVLVRQGECFPVDGVIVKGTTTVDASILTGEPQQELPCGSAVCSGSINLWQDVVIRAENDYFDSMINRTLYEANRPVETEQAKPRVNKFIYLYSALIIVGIAAALLIPFGLGIFSIPLLLQTLTGIVFTICPCTWAMAHELSGLWSSYQRNKEGIILRDGQLTDHFDGIDTVVFDKTGTLTTNESKVAFCEGIEPAVWSRIYLLEKKHGAKHPLAKTLISFCKSRGYHNTDIRDVSEPMFDKKSRGLSAKVQGVELLIGNQEYMTEANIDLPDPLPNKVQQQIQAGLTPLYVAEKRKDIDRKEYVGVICIEHPERTAILPGLRRLKGEGKRLIMLTGDTEEAAKGFNKRCGSLFLEENIHFKQTPDMKAKYLTDLIHGCDLSLVHELPNNTAQHKNCYLFIKNNNIPQLYYVTPDGNCAEVKINDFNKFEKELSVLRTKNENRLHLSKKQIKALITENGGHVPSKPVKKPVFVVDGLNDALGSRIDGVISCSITPDTSAAYFTQMSLNGSLDYLFEHERLNRFVKKNKRQNQMLMAYSALIFLTFIISFSVVGIAVSPLIPLGVMLSTTLMVLFNSYRASLSVDVALDKKFSLFKSFIVSDLSLGLLVGGGTLFIAALLIATLASGGLALPAISFTAGAVAATYSACLLGSVLFSSVFTLFSAAYLLFDKGLARKDKVDEAIEDKTVEILPKPVPNPYKESHYTELFKKTSPDEAQQHNRGAVPKRRASI